MKRNLKKHVKQTAAVVLATSMVVGTNGIPVVTDSGFATVVEAAEADENGFVIEDTILTEYQGTATEVDIPEGVTEIGEGAFQDNTTITSVIIPDTVVTINAKAFSGCTALASVTLSKELNAIYGCAFENCTSLTSIEIPKSITECDYYSYHNNQGPFYNSGITDVTFEEGTTTIAEYLFAGAANLSSIEMPNTITLIRTGAFRDTGLESIVIGENVTKIEEVAFYNCTKATSLSLNENLEFVDGGAFGNCTGITSVEIPASLKEADGESYHDDRGPFYGSGLTTVTFADKSTTIASHLFAGVQALTNIEIPDTITTIKEYAFRSTGLESITIGESVTRIEHCAFYDCNNLASVTLNDYVEFLGQEAFAECEKITSIHIPASLIEAGNDYTNEKGPFRNTGITEVTFEEGIEIIAPNLLQSMPYLEEVTIPNTVEVIGEYAFRGTPLKEIDIPWSVFEVNKGAFSKCTNLTKVVMTDNVDFLGNSAFSECTALVDVTLSKRISKIQEGAFKGCSSLESIVIPDSVEVIEESAFQNCSSLNSFDTTGSVKEIYAYAFSNTAFEEFVAWEGLEQINGEAFSECKKLVKVVLPDSLVKLGDKVFFKCGELAEVTFGTGLTVISEGTFSDCGSLTKVVFPYGVKEIKTDVFHNCTSLTEVTIPKTAETLVEGMFSYPKKTTVYGVAGSAAETYAEEEGTKFEALTTVATGVALNESDIIMYKGQDKKMAINVTPIEFIDDVTWSSSNEEVATVAEDGTVEAHEVGEADITVTVGNVSATCKVTVMNAVETESKKDRVAVAAEDINKEIKTEVATLKISDNAVASAQAVVVRSEKLGNGDKADIFKQADDVLKATEKYNTDTYALYDFKIMEQATGMDVALEDKVEITIDVPGGMDAEKVAVARMKNVTVMDADAEELEVLEVSVSEDGKKLTFATDTMGTFAVIETEEVQSGDNSGDDSGEKPDDGQQGTTQTWMTGDVDGNKKVELSDAQAILKAALKITKLEGDSLLAADVNKDNKVDLSDAQKTLKVALKIEKFDK